MRIAEFVWEQPMKDLLLKAKSVHSHKPDKEFAKATGKEQNCQQK
jgi:hypothetical protein